MPVQRLLRISIAVALLTMALKTGAWWLTDSVGMLSDAMESLVNLASAAFGLAMVIVAARPPDAEHPFGHTKAEYFASGFEGLLIAVAAFGIFWAAWQRLLAPHALQDLGWGVALVVASAVLNGLLARRMLRVGREQRSVALEADARHLYTDVWTSAGVVVGVLLVPVTGWLWLDPALAVAVALNILREGAKLIWGSVDGLMDTAAAPEVKARIERTLAQFADPAMRFDHMITRRAGRRLFVDVHMHVPAGWTLGRAAALRGDVEQALMSEVPGLRASIQLLPMEVEAHSAGHDDCG